MKLLLVNQSSYFREKTVDELGPFLSPILPFLEIRRWICTAAYFFNWLFLSYEAKFLASWQPIQILIIANRHKDHICSI